MKVSVCTVTYNHEPYIRQTLDSVLMQDVDFPYEIIVGDDGSTDGTRAILQEYADAYPDRVRLVLHETNQGPRKNVQSVRERVRGEYIAILDGDDFWIDSTKLRRQIKFLDSHRTFSATACRYRSVFESTTNRHGPAVSPEQPEIIDMKQYLDGVWIGASGFVYRVSMVPEIPDWTWDLHCGDKGLQFLCVRQGPIRFFNEIMSAYRIHGGGMYSGIGLQQRVQWMVEYLKVFDDELDGAYSHILHPRIASKYYLLAFLCDEHGDRAGSLEAVRRARQFSFPVGQRVLEEGRRIIRQMPALHAGLRRLKGALRAPATS
jgi:glycosyltransferase involved in cell wall biosynthesis